LTPEKATGRNRSGKAIQYCEAHRIGHETRLIDDIAVVEGKAVKLGDLAQYVLDNDFSEAVPAFITMLATPLAFSIATGLRLGLIS
jgi:hypothetical protein